MPRTRILRVDTSFYEKFEYLWQQRQQEARKRMSMPEFSRELGLNINLPPPPRLNKAIKRGRYE